MHDKAADRNIFVHANRRTSREVGHPRLRHDRDDDRIVGDRVDAIVRAQLEHVGARLGEADRRIRAIRTAEGGFVRPGIKLPFHGHSPGRRVDHSVQHYGCSEIDDLIRASVDDWETGRTWPIRRTRGLDDLKTVDVDRGKMTECLL